MIRLAREAAPVAVAELRQGNRGLWGPLLVTGFLLLLYLFLLAAVGIAAQSVEATPWAVGATLFLATGAAASLLAGLGLPVAASLSIVSERTRRTWDLLRQAPIGAGAIVVGKASGVAATTLLLLAAAMPVLAASFLLGGVEPGRFALAWLSLCLSLLHLSAIGIHLSATSATPARAVAKTAALLVVVGIVTLPFVLAAIFSDTGIFPFAHVLYVHPVVAFGRAGTVDVDLLGRAIPEWILGDLLLLALIGASLAQAAGRLVPRARDVGPWTRLFTLAAFGLIVGPPLLEEGVTVQGLLWRSLPALFGYQFLLALGASSPLDAREAAGRSYLLSPRGLLLDRLSSLPGLIILAGLLVAALAWRAAPDDLRPVTSLSLWGGIAALTGAAVAWCLLLLGVESLVGNLAVSRTIVLFALLSLGLSSLVPGTPHAAWPGPDNDAGAVREAARATNPAFTLYVLLMGPSDESGGIEINGEEVLDAEGPAPRPETVREIARRRARIGAALRGAAAADATIALLGLGLYALGARRARRVSRTGSASGRAP